MKYLNISPSLKCNSGSVLLYSSVFRMQCGYVAKHIVSLVMGACLSFTISSFNPAHIKHLAFPKGTMGEGDGTPLQYSCLENPMDGGAWWAAVHGVTEGRTRLSDFTLTFHFPALEKEMATHSSVLAWRIPGIGEPGGLPSMGSHRIGHD